MTTATKTFLITPTGEAIYPYLTTPDAKFGDPKFHTKLQFATDSPSAQEFMTALENIAERHYQECLKLAPKGKRVRKAYLPFIDKQDGTAVLSAKLNAGGINSRTQQAFTQKPAIYDERNKPWDESAGIYSGTIMKLQVEVVPYNTPTLGAGVSLRIKAVKIEKRAERGGSANPFGAPQEEQEENPFADSSSSHQEPTASSVSQGYDADDYGDF